MNFGDDPRGIKKGSVIACGGFVDSDLGTQTTMEKPRMIAARYLSI